MNCRTCIAIFTNLDDFRLHYQDDWHRYNIKAKLRGRSPISQEEFCNIEDGISSISGSESEEETTSRTYFRNPKIDFLNKEGQQMSIYRCLVYQKKVCVPKKKLFLFISILTLEHFCRNHFQMILMYCKQLINCHPRTNGQLLCLVEATSPQRYLKVLPLPLLL